MGPGFGETFAAFQASSLGLFGTQAEQVRSFYAVTDDASAFAVRGLSVIGEHLTTSRTGNPPACQLRLRDLDMCVAIRA